MNMVRFSAGGIDFGNEVELQFDISKPSAWTQHVPFMAWLVAVMQPKTFVELGTHWGTSFFAACESAQHSQIPMRAVAVDLWEGDQHAGFYGTEVFDSVKHRAQKYANAELLKTSFDEARTAFRDATIDLLHIDGLHTYDAVKSDFETWISAMSDQGVILLHDIAEFRDDFGVHVLWNELSEQFPHFHFDHGHGLGVLLVGKHQNPKLKALSESETNDAGAHIRLLFSSRGAQLDVTRLERELDDLALHQVPSLRQQIDDLTQRENELSERESALTRELQSLFASKSWRLTKPLRAVTGTFRRR